MMLSLQSFAKPLMIAHAGGGIEGQTYSNSIEALNLNYQRGFRLFEIDFSWTSDSKLVCLHDWHKRFKKVFGHKTKQAVSYTEFESLLENTKGLHPCTLASLSVWMQAHPDSRIITDVKYDNLKALKIIAKDYPDLIDAFIPQIYQPDEYQQAKAMGFKDIIWILYQYEGGLKTVADHAVNMDLFALSMRASQAKKKSTQQIHTNAQRIFVYTINAEKDVRELVNKYHVSGIYTDFLDSE